MRGAQLVLAGKRVSQSSSQQYTRRTLPDFPGIMLARFILTLMVVMSLEAKPLHDEIDELITYVFGKDTDNNPQQPTYQAGDGNHQKPNNNGVEEINKLNGESNNLNTACQGGLEQQQILGINGGVGNYQKPNNFGWESHQQKPSHHKIECNNQKPSHHGDQSNLLKPNHHREENEHQNPNSNGGDVNYQKPNYQGGDVNYQKPNHQGEDVNYQKPNHQGDVNYQKPNHQGGDVNYQKPNHQGGDVNYQKPNQQGGDGNYNKPNYAGWEGSNHQVINQSETGYYHKPSHQGSGSHHSQQANHTHTENHSQFPRETEESCTCVPYYLCPNGTTLTDGTGLLDIRVKPGACEDFMDVCCKEPVDDDHSIKPTHTKRQGCGQRHPEGVGFRITGNHNNEAQFGEFPWMVAILKRANYNGENHLEYQCGGALIHERVVLTAAHCIRARSKNELLVRAGEWDTQRTTEVFPHQDMNITYLIYHPKFNSGNLRYDYGLIILEKPLVLGDNIDTVCVPKPGEVRLHTECYASGWGKDEFGDYGKSQVILKKIDLPIVPRDRCLQLLRETRLGSHFNLHKSFVCAGGVPGKDTCKGDGGSPLVCPIEGKHGTYEITGIVSWGIGCGGETPGVYADVAYAREWIDENLHNYGIELE